MKSSIKRRACHAFGGGEFFYKVFHSSHKAYGAAMGRKRRCTSKIKRLPVWGSLLTINVLYNIEITLV